MQLDLEETLRWSLRLRRDELDRERGKGKDASMHSRVMSINTGDVRYRYQIATTRDAWSDRTVYAGIVVVSRS